MISLEAARVPLQRGVRVESAPLSRTMSPGVVVPGCGDSGAILAAMDAGLAPGPAPAGLPGLASGNSDSRVHVQLHALAKIHDQKART